MTDHHWLSVLTPDVSLGIPQEKTPKYSLSLFPPFFLAVVYSGHNSGPPGHGDVHGPNRDRHLLSKCSIWLILRFRALIGVHENGVSNGYCNWAWLTRRLLLLAELKLNGQLEWSMARWHERAGLLMDFISVTVWPMSWVMDLGRICVISWENGLTPTTCKNMSNARHQCSSKSSWWFTL